MQTSVTPKVTCINLTHEPNMKGITLFCLLELKLFVNSSVAS